MEDNRGNILMYQTVDGKTAIEVMLSNDTVWLTIDKMAELFQRNKSTISRHIKNILECGELTAESTVAFFATVQKEGKRNVEREIVYYNLDMIISVGYRVNSIRGVQFRMWATSVLREYLIKGFAMNDALLKNAGRSGQEETGEEYAKFHQRTMYELSPVELHFIENFEKEQKLLKSIK